MLLGMTAIDLTGTWTGHYQQNGGRHGITMQIVQRGQSFVGRMRDDDTILSGRETLHAQPSKGKPGQGDVLAEAEVPLAMADAFRGGQMRTTELASGS